MMKEWTNPELTQLDIKETAYNWCTRGKDGGYLGDGTISGHGSWDGVDHTKDPGNSDIEDSLS